MLGLGFMQGFFSLQYINMILFIYCNVYGKILAFILVIHPSDFEPMHDFIFQVQ